MTICYSNGDLLNRLAGANKKTVQDWAMCVADASRCFYKFAAFASLRVLARDLNDSLVYF